MANELVDVTPPPMRPALRTDIEALKVGQTLRVDTASLQSLRTIASRVANSADPTRTFQTWEKDGLFYVRRVA